VANALRNTMSALRNSRSWRITEPLRRLKSMFSRPHRKRKSSHHVTG
jgi:hypothetical protein